LVLIAWAFIVAWHRWVRSMKAECSTRGLEKGGDSQ
jgi:hypothetical protein